MAKSFYFYCFVCAFFGGVFVGDFGLGGVDFIGDDFFRIFALVVGGLYFLRIFVEIITLRVILVILLGIFCGMLRFFVSMSGGEFQEGFVELNGCIVDEVDVRSDKVKYTIEAEGIRGLVLVNGARYPVYEYGDCLNVKGFLGRPEAIEDFEYDKYLARYGIYAVMYRVEIEKIEGEPDGGDGARDWIFRGLYKFKEIFEARLGEIYAEPHASFMAGLILGSRKGIPRHLMEDFNVCGLTHIIAISGYNITLIVILVSGIFSFLERRKKVIVSIVFIVSFVLLVGGSAAVVRAGIMGGIALIALWYGREYDVGIGIFVAGFLMGLWNPKIIVYDVGFQLSFLATMGLVYVSPLIEKYFEFLPQALAVRESVVMTLSAQVLALPVIVLNFGRLSLISPIANLFVLPFIPLAMLFGFLGVALSFLWGGSGMFAGFFGYLILELIVFFVKVFSKAPLASVDIEWFSWWMLLGYYFLVGKIIFRKRKFD